MSDLRWLVRLCLSRVGFGLINTVFAALIPLLRPAWAMSASQAGAVQSAWHAGYIVSLVAASLFAGRYGARRTYLAMGWAACASALLFALGARDFASALVLYGVAGLCAGGSYVPGLTLVAERFPPAARGRAMGAYIAAASLGYAIGLVGASVLAEAAGVTAGFLLAAGAALAGQLLARATLRDTPNVVNVAAPTDATHPRTAPLAATIAATAALWRQKPARYAILGYAFHAWELLALWAWLPAFLAAAVARDGGDAATLAVAGASLAALAHVASVPGSLFGGAWSDRWGRTPVILAMSLASIACALVFGWLLAAPLWLIVCVALIFNLLAVGDSAIFSATLTEVVPPQQLAAAYALRSVAGFGMGVASPWLFGVVLDVVGATAGEAQAWGWAWMLLGAVALAGPWATWRLRRGQRAASAQ